MQAGQASNHAQAEGASAAASRLPARSKGRSRQRFNSWLTALLVILVLIQGNRLMREHGALVRDITEDQLFLPSRVGERMLGELQDTLQVKAFFTGDVKIGSVQIAKRRLIDQLEEYGRASRGRMQISYLDPNSSPEARSEATSLGIVPAPALVDQGVSKVAQDVWLGVVLRYRGKESVLKWVLPQYMESKFLGALRKVTRERLPSVGFVTGDGRNLDPRFGPMRDLLQDQYRLHEALDLALGLEIPESVDVLVVAEPTNLHPRVAYEIDRFVQRGGRALLLLDGLRVDLAGQYVQSIPSGLEAMLASWGVQPRPGVLWDQQSHNVLKARLAEDEAPVSYDYPFWLRVPKQAMHASLPATAGLPGVNLYWAQELDYSPIEGLLAEDLLWTSEETWSLPSDEPGLVHLEALEELQRRVRPAGAARRVLGLSLSGLFPSAFTAGVPAALDPIKLALHEDRVQRALAAGLEPPALEVVLLEEPVQSAELESQVILIGDADWAAGERFFGPANRLFFVNLVDTLALENDLLALRSRQPIERPIDDFLAEERAAIGLMGDPEDVQEGEQLTLAKYEDLASQLAARRRWKLMALASGGSLGLALLLGFLWRQSFGRTPSVSPRPGLSGLSQGDES